ncbi:MAG TPA: hypothetical protein VGM20_07755 [Gemmatimonadales bacterium]
MSDFQVSGLTGRASEQVAFKRNEIVRVVVTNVNPFLFNYAIAAKDSQIVQEASPLDFFNLAFKPLGLSIPSAPPPRTAAAFSVGQPLPSCPDGPEPQRAITALADNAWLSLKKIDTILATTLLDGDRSRSEFDAQAGTIYNSQIAAREVHDAAQRASRALGWLSDSITNDVAVINVLLSVTQSRLDSVRDLVKPNKSKIDVACPKLTATQSELDKDVGNAQTYLNTLRTERDAARTAYRTFQNTVDDPAAYYAMLMLPRFDKPMDITIRVSRSHVAPAVLFTPVDDGARSPGGGGADGNSSNRSAVTATATVTVPTANSTNGPPDPTSPAPKSSTATGTTPAAKPAAAGGDQGSLTTLTEQRLHLGGKPEFSIGVGLMVASVSNRQYSAVASGPPNAGPGTTTYLVGLTGNNQFRLVPAITLNARLCSLDSKERWSLHGVFGTGLRTQGAGTSLDYLAGLAVSPKDSKFMINATVYAGDQQRLGGLRLGDELPTNTVPVQTSTRVGVAVGFTFQVY